MTIAIFGLTGNTGRILGKLALDSGYKVVALMRNPKKTGASSYTPRTHGSKWTYSSFPNK